MEMNDDSVIELHGHKSASQRRELALQIEAKRMQILADHLQAILILLIRRTGQPQTFLKEDINATLGQTLDSIETEDKLSVVFSAADFIEDSAETTSLIVKP